MRFSWTSADCTVKAQVNARGYVSIVHETDLSQNVKGRVKPDVGTFFQVLWVDDEFPTVDKCASIPGCEVRDATCLCSTSVSAAAVFTALPSKEDVLSRLHIGAINPASSEKYIKCTAPSCLSSPLDVYFSNQDVTIDSLILQALDDETIFALPDPVTRNMIYLSNTESVVYLGSSFAFRNPPMFNTVVDQTARDAIYETDAVLWHYTKHSNTAPFVAMRFIQHLVTSNPSPRYVSVVSKAFKEGVFDSFGSGKYGCLEATIAAVLLDPEARSTTLEYDATSGKSRSPLMKLMSIFRAMELGTANGQSREVDLIFMKDKIGQAPYYAPSVFSFFLPEYQPVGPVSESRELSLFLLFKIMHKTHTYCPLLRYLIWALFHLRHSCTTAPSLLDSLTALCLWLCMVFKIAKKDLALDSLDIHSQTIQVIGFNAI